MRYCLRLFWGLVLVIGGGTIDSVAQTFEEALAATYMGNPTLAAARASLRATDEEVPQAISNWRPTVSLAGDYGTSAVRNHTGTGTDKGQHRDPASMSLSIEQPLYRGGRTVAATKEAMNNVRAARARLTSTEQSVLLDAATVFMNVVRDQAVLELNVNNEQVLRRQLEATQDRFRVGEVTRTDVHQAEARLSGATADRIQAEGNLEVSRAEYKNVVGEFPGSLTGPVVPSGVPENLDSAINEALSSNPDVQASVFEERASVANAEEVRGELLPTVSLSGSAARNYDSAGESTRISTYTASVEISVPLYQSGSVYSRLRSARQGIAQDRQQIEDERRSAIEGATRAWETMQAAQAAIQAFETQVTANEVALDGVQREAAVGSRTVLDVLDAEQELLDSRVSLVRARRNLIVAVYELKSALGALTAQKLNLPVDYYDPERHYLEVRGKWFGGTSTGDGSTAQ